MDTRLTVIEKRLKKVKRIISVASGKGGVGKSLVASNIALNLANKGKTCEGTSCVFDSCTGLQVLEYLCVTGGRATFKANCPSNHKCSEGACVEV